MTVWLCVRGGTWGFADSTRTMRNFPEGVHEADPVTQDFVRRAGISPQRTLVQSDEPPCLTTPPSGEPLRSLRGWEPRLVLPRGAVLLLADPATADAAIRADPPRQPSQPGQHAEVPLDHGCPFCTRRWPSSQIRDLHISEEHGPEAQAAQEALPPPPPEPEPALTNALELPHEEVAGRAG